MVLTTMVVGKAQDDLPINDEEKIQFKPGLYLSFEDFIYNVPVNFDQVEGDLQNFFENPMNSKKLTITRDLSTKEVEQSAIWGYNDGENVFLNRSLFNGINLDIVGGLKIKVDPWVRIQTVGTLSYILFLTTIQSYSQNQLGGQNYIHSEQSNYILNTKDGKFYEGNLKALKDLITDDPELLAAFEISREDKVVKFFTFLRRYNERHPFQFR
jgi:hypothetical protein